MQMKGKEVDYFDMFIKAASICDRSAQALDELFDNLSDTETKSAAIHELEHEGDDLYHELYYHLIRSFITPIDREDILAIAHDIEDTIDAIDEVSIMMHTLSVKSIREPAKELINLINKGCVAMVAAAVEFKNFKRSKELPELLVEINHIEEQGDTLFQSAIKSLFAEEKDVIEVVKWQNVFNSLEDVLDSIENVADIMEGVIVKNS